MINIILSDFSRTVLFPKDKEYAGSLNELYKSIQGEEVDIFDYFEFNQEILDYFKDQKSNGIKLYVFTSGTMQDDPAFRKILDKIFTDIFTIESIGGLKKTDVEAYKKIVEILRVKPDEVLFIDDDGKNIEAAKEVGLQVILYEDINSLR